MLIAVDVEREVPQNDYMQNASDPHAVAHINSCGVTGSLRVCGVTNTQAVSGLVQCPQPGGV